MSKEMIMEKLASLFKEEQWGRLDPRKIGISRFKILDDLINSILSESLEDEVVEMARVQLKESEFSVTAIYLLGVIAYHKDITDDKVRLKELVDIFLEQHKWAVVEHVAEKILEYGENRVALKALAQSLEKLARQKEAVPVWEELLKIDRFDASVAKKLSYAILEEDQAKSIQYMKLAIEGFIRNYEFDEIQTVWSKLMNFSWDDSAFFERVERMLVDVKRKDLAAEMLCDLLEKYRSEDVDYSIVLLKKILTYQPADIASRKILISLYNEKYGEHSQYSQFYKISKLGDYGVNVKTAIESFEKNIVFDKGNYVHHRSWGLGVIADIDSEKIVIDFDEKSNHQMSVQMALQSLIPIPQDHFYVLQSKDKDGMKKMFSENLIEFFGILLRSYGGKINVSSIKKELIPLYLDQKNWSKWWSKARTILKKDSLLGISDKDKDLVFLRSQAVTYADELLDRFNKCKSFSSRLDIAIEFVNNIEDKDAEKIVVPISEFFKGASDEGSNTKLILSYFILRSLGKFIDKKELNLDSIKKRVISFIKDSSDLPIISMKITSYDYKKDFVNLIEEVRDDWKEVVTELLFETPVRIHRYIMNSLIRSRAYENINEFIDRVISGGKEFPEIFLWISKSIFSKSWNYEWLEYSKSELTLTHFRVINELKRVEIGKNRLKNIALGLLFEDDAEILREIINDNEQEYLNKFYDITISAGYIEEGYLEKFLKLITEKYPDFHPVEEASSSDENILNTEELIVTESGFQKKSDMLNNMVNIEMAKLSKELSQTSDVGGDMRENVDYNALLEKQAILKLSISKLDADLKRAKILNLKDVSTDLVSIGTVVEVESHNTKEKSKYAILGPWDADFDKNILSYRSPVAKELLSKKIDDNVDLRLGDFVQKVKIISIDKYC